MKAVIVRVKAAFHEAWRLLLVLAVGLLLGLFVLLSAWAEPATATVRPGFEDRLVASVTRPMGLAFAPDGRVLVLTKAGQVRVHKNGQLLQTPALNISGKICSGREAGLLGIALDPSFTTNRHVYLFYRSERAIRSTGRPSPT